MEQVTRLFDLISRYSEKYPAKEVVFAKKENGEWRKVGIDEYIEKTNDISYGLLQLGVLPGDRIATITDNRPEWNFLDMAIMQTGAVHVPVYPTISESDYKYILNHSGVKFVFVSGQEILRKIEHIFDQVDGLQGIYTFRKQENYKHLSELITLGKEYPAPGKIEALKAGIKGSDLATIIYTSGTTGNPKGVMLSHDNILSNVVAVHEIPPVGPEGKSISYLPLCHVYERMMNYTFQYLGIAIYYVENMGTIVDNVKEVKPEILITVPRLLEKVYDKIIATGRKLKGLKKGIFFWSVNVGLRFEPGKLRNPVYFIQHLFADMMVFKKWRAALGGNMKVVVSGGAALQPRLARVFTAAGIPVLEGYGLTETSPVISVNHFGKHGRKFGTVGPVLKGIEVKIDHDGEILCKGPNVMMGYYLEPELTREVIDDDGWFHTGDIGALEEHGHLRITGRKKEIFKTSLGKYISPSLIENKFKESPFIDNILVIGENQKFAAAIIVPSFDHLKSYCSVKGYEYPSNELIIKSPVIRKRFQKEIDKYNTFFGETEQIKKFELIDHEWSVDLRELTANLKLRRHFICEKYRDLVEKIFS